MGLADGGEPGTRALVAGRTIATEADVVLWPARGKAMVEGIGLNVVDLRGVDPADDVRLGGAGLLLVGSAVAFGAWAARTAVPIGVVPAVVEVAAGASARMEALHLLVGEDESEAQAAADWAALRGMACGVAEGSLAAVTRLGPAPVTGSGAVVLDLRTGAGRIDASPALLGLLAVGAPVLFGEDTPLRSTLEGVGLGGGSTMSWPGWSGWPGWGPQRLGGHRGRRWGSWRRGSGRTGRGRRSSGRWMGRCGISGGGRRIGRSSGRVGMCW